MATNPARLIAPPATGRDWLKVVLVQLAALLEPAAGPWPAPRRRSDERGGAALVTHLV
jgi:hypothetical protein